MSADLDRQEYKTIIDLQGMKGQDFDREYLKHIIDNSNKDLALFEQVAKESQNPDLKSYAQKNLPVMRDHIGVAQDLLNKVGQQG